MQTELKKLLLDALNAADSILEFTRNRHYSDITTDNRISFPAFGENWRFCWRVDFIEPIRLQTEIKYKVKREA